MHALLESPSKLIDAETFATRYIEMFVEQFSGDDGSDATLVRVFQTDRAQLVRAFEAFLVRLKSELYAAESWREAQHYHSTETMSAQVSRIATLLEERAASDRASKVDVGRALADAAIASAEMRAWPSEIHGMRLETPAFDRLIRRVKDEPAGRTLLIGEAGTGKSALLARVAPALEERSITVFAIKADQLPASLASLDDLARALGVDEGLENRIAALAGERPVALLLDQLDAVSDVMDLHSHRMQLLLQLVHRMGVRARAGDTPLPIHVIVSSRPFEAAHDARFQQLKAEALRLDLLGED
ncbi:MAG: ATP-binding protein [Novosphingobium sp.]